MSKLFRILLIVLAIVLLAAGGAAFWAYRCTQHVPEMYSAALKADPHQQQIEGEKLEREILALHNETAVSREREASWKSVISAEQVNGWLATHLTKKAPDLLPDDLRDPRVAIDNDKVTIFCKYDGDQIETVLSLEANLFLTDRTNELGLEIHGARAGSLRLPLSQVIDQVTKAGEQSGLVIRWVQRTGNPVALISIPRKVEKSDRLFTLETLELRTGAVYLGGKTEPNKKRE